jgi:hypothetical protein
LESKIGNISILFFYFCEGNTAVSS